MIMGVIERSLKASLRSLEWIVAAGPGEVGERRSGVAPEERAADLAGRRRRQQRSA